jgi:uncharacterized protein (TIGR00730 family)
MTINESDVPTRPGRATTGDAGIDRELTRLLDQSGARRRDRDLLFEILVTAVQLAGDGDDRLDLKIANAALKEMRTAFLAFAPYHNVPKVTIFGSARTLPTDPKYRQARDLARELASKGWMVVTGAGPGIMAAGLEGAGKDKAFGVTIRLPFEQIDSPYLSSQNLISMKYFFTRKLMLMKESTGFVSLPGGFGTLDETFELLTLIQTGKAEPAPIVLLDEPNGSFWDGFMRFIRDDVMPHGLIDDDDLHLMYVTDRVDEATDELLRFTRNYQSLRWVGDDLVLRMRYAPDDAQLAALNHEFGSITTDGSIRRTEALPQERRDRDGLDLQRVALKYNGFTAGGLRRLINALNGLQSVEQ